MKVAALHLINLLEFAQVRGVLPSRVLLPLEQAGYDLQEETLLLPVSDFYRALAVVNQDIQDEQWGIKAGNFLTLKLLGLIYRISLQATTIEEAFHYLHTYLQSTLPLVESQTAITTEKITVVMHIKNKEYNLNRIILENVLSIIAREIALMATQEVPFKLTSPYFQTSYPKNWESGTAFSISFPPVILKAALRGRQAEQLELLVPEYITLIEKFRAGESSFSNTVKVTILSMSDPHLPDITTVSEALYLTPRSLQRRLERENSSFRELLQELKIQICSFLMRHREYSTTSMSYILGYAEPAAFIHSFKKWFGDSPERVRQNLNKSIPN